MSRFCFSRVALLFLFFGFVTILSAVDGVVLIDQNRALAGNVTPGDAAGFPVTITQPGSYRLSGNLTVPSGLSGIVITVPNVAIDLNGFNITTPVQDGSSSARGIKYEGLEFFSTGINIRNGVIEGFSVPIQLNFISPVPPITFASCSHCTLEDLIMRWSFNGSSSIDLGNYVRVHRITAQNHFIIVHCPAVVSETVARSISQASVFNPGDSIRSEGQCRFVNNAVLF